VIRDNDTKLTSQLGAAIESKGAKIKRNTPMSPNLRAHVERCIQSLKQECLGKFVIAAERFVVISGLLVPAGTIKTFIRTWL
jgi:hypothetical protein